MELALVPELVIAMIVASGMIGWVAGERVGANRMRLSVR